MVVGRGVDLGERDFWEEGDMVEWVRKVNCTFTTLGSISRWYMFVSAIPGLFEDLMYS